MDIRSMCSSSSPISSDQSDKSKVSGFASHVQSLPSPPLMETVNEKKGSSLPPLTSILPPLHPKQPHHDTSSSSNPKSPSSRVNYPQPPVQSISQRSSLTSPLSSSSSYSSQPSDDTTNKMWSRQPPPHPTSYYHQSYPPPPQPPPPPPPSQYSYTPQSQQPQQQSVRHYPYPSATYPPAYATSTSYTSSGNNINGDDDDDSPYIFQTVEQSLAKMGKAVDHCNQISHFITQYRDMKMHSQWNGIYPQVSESTLTDMINRAFDVLNILSGLKSDISKRRSSASHGEIDLIRKQRTLGASTRSKYRKRSKRAAPPGRCHSCNISETPEWRRGPDGARTLCNACGLHFAKITRKRALSAMQQAEQQQQQQIGQQQKQPQQQQVTSPSDDSNVSDNSNIMSAPATPGASDVEKDNEQSIEIIDD